MARPFAPLRHLLRPAVFLLLGVGSALGVGWALASTRDPRLGVVTSASVFDGEANWSVTQWSRTGATCVLSERQLVTGSWAPWQVVGLPNTDGPGDIPTAWAQSEQNAPGEWLELTYANAVVPEAVHVVETYNPGALIGVSVFKEDGTEVTVWEGNDPTRPGAGQGTSVIPIAVDFPVRRVKLHLDSVAVPSWNEIDAVALVERDTKAVQWAARAKASSSYAGGHRTGPTTPVTSLLPRWSGLREPGPAFASGGVTGETRVAAAFGWPMAVVYGNADVPPAANAPPGPAGATGDADALTELEVLGGLPSPGTSPTPPGAVQVYTLGVRPLGGRRGTVAPPGPGSGGAPPNVQSRLTAVAPGNPGITWAVPLPRRVLWTGLAVNGLLYAVVLAGLYYLLVLPKQFVREVKRVKAGRCIACGYDLGYDFVRGCPECGWRRRDGGAAGSPRVAGVEGWDGKATAPARDAREVGEVEVELKPGHGPEVAQPRGGARV